MAIWPILMVVVAAAVSDAADTNGVHQPCADTKIQRSDGFTFGIAFSSKNNFYNDQSHQLSPCDRRLSLSSLGSQLALFRPRVDEISLLSINTSTFFPVLFTSFFWRDLPTFHLSLIFSLFRFKIPFLVWLIELMGTFLTSREKFHLCVFWICT